MMATWAAAIAAITATQSWDVTLGPDRKWAGNGH